MSLLEKDNTKKEQVDEKTAEQLEFEASGNNKEYEVEGIRNSAVYARKSEVGHLSSLYYLVSQKSYPEDESTWEPALAVYYLRKLVSIFHKDHSNKLIANFSPINMAPPMAKHTASPNVNDKRKCGQPISSMQKKAKHKPATY